MGKFSDSAKSVYTAICPVSNTHLELYINVKCNYALISREIYVTPPSNPDSSATIGTVPQGTKAVTVILSIDYNDQLARPVYRYFKVPISWTVDSGYPIQVITEVHDEFQIRSTAAGTPFPGGGVSKITDIAD